MFVLRPARLGDAARATGGGGLICGGGIGDAERDRADAITVKPQVIGDVALGLQRRREHEADLALLEDVAGPVADARLRPGVRDDVESEGLAVVVRGLARIPHPQLDVVGALEHGHGYLGYLNHVVLL